MMGLLERDVLVISQKAKLIEMTNEYWILDPEGAEVEAIRQEGQSKSKKVFRFLTDLDQFLTHRLSVFEADGTKLLENRTTRQGLQVHAEDPRRQRGRPRQEHFSLRGTGGELLGWIDAENWRSWDFVINDADGAEVGRITKKWAGILREGFTTADHYILQITGPTPPELRFQLVASAAALDIALKQDDTGGLGFGGLDLGDLIP